MSFSRTSRRRSPKSFASRRKRAIIITLVLLSLFLGGTIIVLSSVSYYLSVSPQAFLTEAEVVWRNTDSISQLSNQAGDAKMTSHRQDWDGKSDVGVMGDDSLREVWEDLEVIVDDVDASSESLNETDVESVVEEEIKALDEEDREGKEGYWRSSDWEGTVRGTDSWERLANVTTRPGEKIPRLIHQTWKDERLPQKWREAWKECRAGMPDYEYMLWTDDLSRQFVETHYPAFLQMYDSYKYPIQRADSIRYFILNHFGGIYMDLDIGCRRRLDPLLQGDWEVILPITKPVGISNDLILTSKGSAFMQNTVHALPAFNHEWFSNYPTVMFSTGPMFLSAQYAVYASAHPITDANPRAEIRILPKSLYGKNAPASTVPHSFFSHFYGSSWHDDDAGFLLFLGVWGKKLMYVAAVVIVLGIMRLAYLKWSSNSLRQYQVLSILPTTASTSGTPSGLTSPAESTGSTEFPPAFEQVSIPNHIPSDLASAFKRAGDVIFAAPVTLLSTDHRRRARRRTGLLYFVPALFQAGPSSEQRSPRVSMTSPPSIRMARRDRDCDRDSVLPPPYDDPPWVGLGEMADGVASSRDTEETSSSTDGASDVMLREAELVEWEKDARQ